MELWGGMVGKALSPLLPLLLIDCVYVGCPHANRTWPLRRLTGVVVVLVLWLVDYGLQK